MADEEVVGRPLDDLILSLHQDIQTAAQAIAEAARRPAAQARAAAPPGGEELRASDIIFVFNAVSVDLKAAVALETVPEEERPRLVAYPVGFRLRPEAQAVSSLQLNFAPLPRPPGAPATVTVPDVRQKRWSQAIALLKEVGLTLGDITERPIPGIVPGVVFSQRPDPGTEVPAGTAVDLVVAEAVPVVVVPGVVGLMLDKAVETIRAAGLQVGAVNEAVSTQPPGTVLQQSPLAGEEVAPGTSVDLVVAVSPPELEVSIPALPGASGYVDTNHPTTNRMGGGEILSGQDRRTRRTQTFHGVFQIDLSPIPANAQVINAKLQLTGRDATYLDPKGKGIWQLHLLHAGVDADWVNLQYRDIRDAAVVATISPSLSDDDVGVGVVNTLTFDEPQLAILMERLRTTGRLSFRLDGDIQRRVRHIFGWDGRREAAPLLIARYRMNTEKENVDPTVRIDA